MSGETTLQDRQAKYKPGQFTWPDLTSGKYCDGCRLYLRAAPNGESGKCDLVRRRHGYQGAAFKGADAIACSQFQPGVHEDTPAASSPP